MAMVEEEEVNFLKTLMLEELEVEQGSDLTAPSTSSVLKRMHRGVEEAVRLEAEPEELAEKG